MTSPSTSSTNEKQTLCEVTYWTETNWCGATATKTVEYVYSDKAECKVQPKTQWFVNQEECPYLERESEITCGMCRTFAFMIIALIISGLILVTYGAIPLRGHTELMITGCDNTTIHPKPNNCTTTMIPMVDPVDAASRHAFALKCLWLWLATCITCAVGTVIAFIVFHYRWANHREDMLRSNSLANEMDQRFPYNPVDDLEKVSCDHDASLNAYLAEHMWTLLSKIPSISKIRVDAQKQCIVVYLNDTSQRSAAQAILWYYDHVVLAPDHVE